MIQPLVTIIILIPLIIGIISVDINGKPQSIREFLKSDLMTNVTSIVENALPTNISPPEQLDQTETESTEIEEQEEESEPLQPLFDFNMPETEKAIDDFNGSVADAVVFLVFNIKDFGIWIGMSTAPFHYFVALIVAFLLFPIWWLYIIGFFYVVIKENKEIRNEIHNARVRKKLI